MINLNSYERQHTDLCDAALSASSDEECLDHVMRASFVLGDAKLAYYQQARTDIGVWMVLARMGERQRTVQLALGGFPDPDPEIVQIIRGYNRKIRASLV
jgi:hypothetical protein